MHVYARRTEAGDGVVLYILTYVLYNIYREPKDLDSTFQECLILSIPRLAFVYKIIVQTRCRGRSLLDLLAVHCDGFILF